MVQRLGWVLLVLGVGSPSPAGAEFLFGKPGESSLHISALIQVKYTGLDQSDSNQNTFQIRRLRLRLDGDAFPHVRYQFQIAGDAVTTSTPDRVRLLDANVVLNYNPWLQVKAGQFKAPFGAEQLTDPEALHSIERGLVDTLVPGRQLGVMLTSAPDAFSLARGTTSHRVDYGIGVFNGNGINQPANDNSDSLVAGRVVLAPSARLSIGGSVLTSKDPASTAAATAGLAVPGRRNVYGADVYATSGPFHVWAELANQEFHPDGPDANRTARGVYVQPSVFVTKDKLEVWYRYDRFDPDTRLEDNLDKTWHHVGVNYYVRQNGFKIQGEYVAKREKGRLLEDDTFSVMLQILW